MECFFCVVKNDFWVILTSLVYFILWCGLQVKWFTWRYNINLSKKLKYSLSMIGCAFIAYQLLGFCVLLLYQRLTNQWIFSMNNYLRFSEDGKSVAIDYIRSIQLLIGSPIIEEIVLRDILYRLIYSRTKNVLMGFVGANACFSALHIINMLVNASGFYAAFQVVAAFIVGMWFSTRLYLTQNVIEVILLHVANNLFASFLKVEITFAEMELPYLISGL